MDETDAANPTAAVCLGGDRREDYTVFYPSADCLSLGVAVLACRAVRCFVEDIEQPDDVVDVGLDEAGTSKAAPPEPVRMPTTAGNRVRVSRRSPSELATHHHVREHRIRPLRSLQCICRSGCTADV